MKKTDISNPPKNWRSYSDEKLARFLLKSMKKRFTVIGQAHLYDPHEFKQAINDTILKVLDFRKKNKINDLESLCFRFMKHISIDISRKNQKT